METECLTLWADGDSDYVPPKHVQADEHGTHTGYTKGCRCSVCHQFKSRDSHAYKRGLRICKHCGTTYPRTTGGGSKFCADCIADGVYDRHRKAKVTTERICLRCGQQYTKGLRKYQLCTRCTGTPEFRAMGSSFGRHHVPVEMVIMAIDWPYCANEQCGVWLLERHFTRVRSGPLQRHSRKLRYAFVVDHDHSCCPGEASCGSCVRGIICRYCNQLLIQGSEHRLAGLIYYLAR